MNYHITFYFNGGYAICALSDLTSILIFRNAVPFNNVATLLGIGPYFPCSTCI